MDLVQRLREGGHIIPMTSEHSFYLEICYNYAAENSHDLSTKNGGLIIDGKGDILGYGTNQIPCGLNVTEHRLTTRPDKYDWIAHAEFMAIVDSVGKGTTYFGDKTLYAAWCACKTCGLSMSAFGVGKMIGHLSPILWDKERAKLDNNIDWGKSIEIALDMFDEKGIEYFFVEGNLINPVENLHGGKMYTA